MARDFTKKVTGLFHCYAFTELSRYETVPWERERSDGGGPRVVKKES